MTLRHLFRSAQLKTLINRLEHGESYFFGLELETALASALDEASTMLTPQIIRNQPAQSLFHSDFDNFDQYVSDLSGIGFVHTSHGILVQNIPSLPTDTDENVDRLVIQTIPKTRARSLKSLSDDSLHPCFISQRDNPVIKIAHTTLPGYDEAVSKAMSVNRTWCVIRQHSSSTRQVVPGWAGFISETGTLLERLTTIDYYPVINHSITDNATVKECLRISRSASSDVGQKYEITTFDLDVCMKAYPIIWKSPTFYSDHIVMIMSFHLMCAYLKMIGKKMNGSGFTDVLIEYVLMSSRSMEGVVSGKNYVRSVHCHKVVAEALERLLLQKYCNSIGSDNVVSKLPGESVVRIQAFLENRDRQKLDVVLSDEAYTAFLKGYTDFRHGVSVGSLGKTAQFWVSCMDHVWLALLLLQAVKTNDYNLYVGCLSRMSELFFSFNRHNYARYLTFFSLFLANIEETHPSATELLKMGAISVAKSYVPGNICAVDKTIEETMRHAKSRGGAGSRGAGVSGILTNYETYRRWARTTHERSGYVDVMLQMAGMSEEGKRNTHRDVRPSQVRKSEAATRKVVEAFKSFMNPFKLDDDWKLYRIASGAPTLPDIEADFLSVESKGKEAKEAFVKDRLRRMSASLIR